MTQHPFYFDRNEEVTIPMLHTVAQLIPLLEDFEEVGQALDNAIQLKDYVGDKRASIEERLNDVLENDPDNREEIVKGIIGYHHQDHLFKHYDDERELYIREYYLLESKIYNVAYNGLYSKDEPSHPAIPKLVEHFMYLKRKDLQDSSIENSENYDESIQTEDIMESLAEFNYLYRYGHDDE